MNVLKKTLLRACCFILGFIGIGHDYEQIYDETCSWALACKRCKKVDDVHIYKKGQFGDEPPPGMPEITYGGICGGRYIIGRKVVSVSEEISS